MTCAKSSGSENTAEWMVRGKKSIANLGTSPNEPMSKSIKVTRPAFVGWHDRFQRTPEAT
jgi:hypothetical protein